MDAKQQRTKALPQKVILKNSVLFYFVLVKYAILVLMVISIIEGWLSLNYTRKAFNELLDAMAKEDVIPKLNNSQFRTTYVSILAVVVLFELMGFIAIIIENFCLIVFYICFIAFRLIAGIACILFPRLIIFFGLTLFLFALLVVFAIIVRNVNKSSKKRNSFYA